MHVLGRCEGQSRKLTVQLVFGGQQGYWINGLVLATAGRMISEGQGVRAGVHFLADAVDPIVFLNELRQAGVEQTDAFT